MKTIYSVRIPPVTETGNTQLFFVVAADPEELIKIIYNDKFENIKMKPYPDSFRTSFLSNSTVVQIGTCDESSQSRIIMRDPDEPEYNKLYVMRWWSNGVFGIVAYSAKNFDDLMNVMFISSSQKDLEELQVTDMEEFRALFDTDLSEFIVGHTDFPSGVVESSGPGNFPVEI